MAKLYIIPTPIGNLEDITLRAIRVLKEVDVIMAEDTRKTRLLCKHFEIEKEIHSYHKFNEHKSVARIVERIAAGETIALVSDAGTPSISDPGFLLVRECVAQGIDVDCLPGATAFVPALVNSGLPSERFCFEGFLPHKKGRNKRLTALANETRTLVFYESPFRLLKTLTQMIEFFGANRKASISRELTKIYQETINGTLTELLEYYTKATIKGEFVLVVEGKKDSESVNESTENEDAETLDQDMSDDNDGDYGR